MDQQFFSLGRIDICCKGVYLISRKVSKFLSMILTHFSDNYFFSMNVPIATERQFLLFQIKALSIDQEKRSVLINERTKNNQKLLSDIPLWKLFIGEKCQNLRINNTRFRIKNCCQIIITVKHEKCPECARRAILLILQYV